MRLRETTNDYGTPVVEYRCEGCGESFTVCPAPEPEKDDQWTGCMAPACGSYDESRDAMKWFDEGRVRSIPTDKGVRIVPFRVIDGGAAKALGSTPNEIGDGCE